MANKKRKKNYAARKAFAMQGKVQECATYTKVFPPTDPNWKPEQKRLTADEMMMTTWLYMMANSMSGAMERIMHERLHMIPRGWMRYRQATGILLRMCDDLMCTIIPGQLLTIDRMDRNGTVQISQKTASRSASSLCSVATSSMHEIARAAQRGECQICMRQGGEIKACPLRKAFDDCGLLEQQYDESVKCLYRDWTINIPQRLYDNGKGIERE